jgi:hypothetical protein
MPLYATRIEDLGLGDQWMTTLAWGTSTECLRDDRPARSGGGYQTRLGNHSFRATGITAYLENRGTLEKAQRWQTTPARARHSFMTGGATSYFV